MRRAIVGVVLGALLLVGCGGLDKEKFALANRSGQAVKSATDVGVVPGKYRELVQAFATEVSLSRDKATNEKERALAGEYGDALTAYRDALAVLDEKANKAYGPFVAATPEMVRIASTYSLPIAKAVSPERFAAEAISVAKDVYESMGRTPTQAQLESAADAVLKKGSDVMRFTRPPVARIDLLDAEAAVQSLWKIGGDRIEKASRALR
jgi:hypothetical protein